MNTVLRLKSAQHRHLEISKISKDGGDVVAFFPGSRVREKGNFRSIRVVSIFAYREELVELFGEGRY